MSWHNNPRTTFIYQAVLLSMIGTTSLNAHAINLSQADIKSAQHEPLSATITVSDIDANNFNVSLATPDIYQQMGLSADANISVNFIPTSDTSGRITLTSKTPISTPFADVVLNLNNNGEQVIEPQTLLMPLSANNAFTLPENKNTQVITADAQQNLPITTELIPQPEEMLPQHRPEMTTLNDQNLPQTTANTVDDEGKVLSQEEKVIAQITPEGINTQVDILTEQITRRVYPVGQLPTESDFTASEEPIINQTPETPTEEIPPKQTQTGSASYVVQSGDSLWSIANQIAQANHMSVNEVMHAIHNANPDAFNHGNINHLKANVSLSLPDYDVIPSQKAIQEAISAKTSSKSTSKTSNKRSTNNYRAKNTKTRRNTSNTTTSKPTRQALPRAQLTLVTPTQQGTATGTNNKPVQNAKTGGNGNLVGKLQNTRQQTASNAKRVNNLNQELSSASQKLQLQNQKLAELEARLKALKQKK